MTAFRMPVFTTLFIRCLPVLLAGAGLAATAATPVAGAPPPAKHAARPAAKAKAPAKPAKPVEAPLAPATPEQVSAAEQVFYGVYECEFNQSVDIRTSPQHAAYVDVKSGKAVYLMKPVLSSTGAIRLEDVKGEMLMVQINSKSMLMNVKTARRIVDDCISPAQRELIEKARLARAEEAAAAAAASAAPAPAAAGAASAPEDAAPHPQ